MNIEQTKEAIRIMQSWVDGKEVQVRWLLAGSVWIPAGAPCWNWQLMEYRIKPTATLRPWTADEVPLGAWMRSKRNPQDRMLIHWVSSQCDREMWLDKNEQTIGTGQVCFQSR